MNTQKLKELARRATGGIWKAFINEKTNTFAIHTPDDARCGNIIDWMGFDGVNCSKKQKAHNARFIAASNPAVVIQLIEALEAAERERDELRAEIARRDAAAGEPLAFTHESEISNMHATGLYIRGFPADRRLNSEEGYTLALYTAAPPAVVPPEMKHLSDAANTVSEWTHGDEHSCKVNRTALIAAVEALGAQQQKVVAVHKRKSTEVISGQRYSYVLLEDLLPELDAAGVKWEVKK